MTAVSASSVSLDWNDVAGETGFVIERSPDNSSWQPIAIPGQGQTAFTDYTPNEATTYYYRVAGVDNSGTGDYSASICVLTLPASPFGLRRQSGQRE